MPEAGSKTTVAPQLGHFLSVSFTVSSERICSSWFSMDADMTKTIENIFGCKNKSYGWMCQEKQKKQCNQRE
jgi:hypothetical protein